MWRHTAFEHLQFFSYLIYQNQGFCGCISSYLQIITAIDIQRCMIIQDKVVFHISTERKRKLSSTCSKHTITNTLWLHVQNAQCKHGKEEYKNKTTYTTQHQEYLTNTDKYWHNLQILYLLVHGHCCTDCIYLH